MLSTPRLIERPEQHYVAVPARVTMQSMMEVLPRLWPEVSTWLAARGVTPSGPPLIRWVVIDMGREMQIEVGMPVAQALQGDGRVIAGSLPAGRYAVAVHSGHYDQLVAANAALQAWAELERLEWAVESTAEGDAWRARIESYPTDPAAVPNPADWQTEIAYLVAVVPEALPSATPKARAVKPKRRRAKKTKPATKAKRRTAGKPKRARKAKRAAAKSKRRTPKKSKRGAAKRPKRRAVTRVKRRAPRAKRRARR